MPALILMYHDVSDHADAVDPEHRPYVLQPRVFRDQVKTIVQSKLPVITVRDWCSKARRDRTLILTFDDGHVSNHSGALPILCEFGLKATFFVTAGQIGSGDTMNWSQLRELHQAGMEIGSHTLTHRPPSLLNDAELEYELSESRRVLEDGLGAPVISISSPTGFFNPRMRKIAKETGYRALCIGRIGWARPEGDCFSLNRVAVKRGMSMNAFQALLSFDRLALTTLRSRQWMRELARETLGPTVYLQIRETLLANRIFNRNRA